GADASDPDAVAPDGFPPHEDRCRWAVLRETQIHEPRAGCSAFPPPLQRVLPDEAAGLVPGDGEGEAGIERCLLRAHVEAHDAIAALQPAGRHGVETGEPKLLAGTEQEVVDIAAEIRRHEKLVAELADEGDARGP